MPIEIWNSVLSVGLLTLVGAVGWLARTVIHNAKEIAAINRVLKVADIAKEIDTVHSRVTEVSASVANLEGQIDGVKTQVSMMNRHLMERPK